MSIEGRIAVDASFSDLTTGTNLQSLMRLALTSTDSYTSGKVALITGVLPSPAPVSVAVTPTTFRDSSGSVVSFTTVTRFAFAASSQASCIEAAGRGRAFSDAGRVSVSDAVNGGTSGFTLQAFSGTASYTIVVVGT